MGIAVEETQWKIRSFRPGDLPVCRRLYGEGGLRGTALADNDTGADVDDIDAVYMRSPGNHFWVAEAHDGQVLGMVGVQHYAEENAGQIRRLRVAREHERHGIGTALVEAALKFCLENQYLKVTLDTFMEREPAIKVFKKFRFRHENSRLVGNKEVMYFYMDLYAGAPRAPKGEDLHLPPPPSHIIHEPGLGAG
jgi:GNAT superfamily N-acetyltransferase